MIRSKTDHYRADATDAHDIEASGSAQAALRGAPPHSLQLRGSCLLSLALRVPLSRRADQPTPDSGCSTRPRAACRGCACLMRGRGRAKPKTNGGGRVRPTRCVDRSGARTCDGDKGVHVRVRVSIITWASHPSSQRTRLSCVGTCVKKRGDARVGEGAKAVQHRHDILYAALQQQTA
jgi:hypothetical protein